MYQKRLQRATRKTLNDMGGVERLGSYTEWCMYTSHMMKHYSFANFLKHMSFKTCVRTIIVTMALYRHSIHRVWAPEGVGYEAARKDFYGLV